jgi:hypothetical protein
MPYFTRFLICSHIPPQGIIMKDFGLNTNGTGVFLLALNWYFDRTSTNPTLVCISANRLPEIKYIFAKKGCLKYCHIVYIFQLQSRSRIVLETLKFFLFHEGVGLPWNGETKDS